MTDQVINLSDPGSPERVTPADFLQLVIDRRDFHVPTVVIDKGGVKTRRAYNPAHRTWLETQGITLHQTACDMGERAERYDTMGAHWGVLRSGRIIRLCDNDRVVYHGNGWNARCVGIEVNGLYAGQEDDPDTAQDEALRSTWDDPSTPTREKPQQVTPQSMLSLRMLCRFIAYDIASHGGVLRVMGAHRQSSPDRRNDPGEAIWKQAAIPLMGELGLSDGGVGFKLNGGRPIPQVWDPRHSGTAY